jgi:hypothetical protein
MIFILLLQFPRRLNEIESFLVKIVFGSSFSRYRLCTKNDAINWASGCMLRGSVLLGICDEMIPMKYTIYSILYPCWYSR